MGAAAFWIAVAAVLVAGGWWKSRSEAMKHETIRRIIEKTGQVDEVKLKQLFEPPVNPHIAARLELIREVLAKTERVDEALAKELLMPPPDPWAGKQGDGYRVLRVFGTIVSFGAIGLAICFSILHQGDAGQRADALVGFAVASVVALLGAGFFYASRFVPRPPPPKGDRA